MNQSSPLGVCVLSQIKPNQPNCTYHSNYITEVLEHAGLPFAQIDAKNLAALSPDLKILITVGEAALDDAAATALREFVQDGGSWLSLGSVCGLDEVHCVQVVPSPGYNDREFVYTHSTLGEGYLQPAEKHPVLAHLNINLHYYNGIVVKVLSSHAKVLATTQNAHGQKSEAPALVESTFGSGSTLFLAPDVIGAIVRISQGTTVIADGIPAPDGSAPTADGVLKCDDGLALDWHFDRQEVPGVPGLKGFFEPVADQWREVILRGIFYLANKTNVALPMLWLYPRNLPALAHLSHDTDGNYAALGARLLEEVNKAEIYSTWCVIPEGYPKELIEQIKNDGHELATHYNAIDNPWSEEEFAAQCARLKVLFGEQPVSNKNHYTRWEGGTEFFDWCQRQKLQLDQTKGPSKIGEVGFTFGSAQLAFPLADNGEIHSVLEQPLHTQDLVIFAPPQIIPPLLDAVEKHHGILHVLFHPAHIAKPGVADSLHSAVQQAKDRGLEWFTAKQLNAWERARRKVKVQAEFTEKDAAPKVLLSAPEPLNGATILVLGHHQTVEIDGEQYAAQPSTRWGFEFSAVTLGME
jgi:hypothetical protein